MDKGNADLIFGIPKDILSYYFGHFLRDIFNAYPWKILSRIYFCLMITSQKYSNWFLFIIL